MPAPAQEVAETLYAQFERCEPSPLLGERCLPDISILSDPAFADVWANPVAVADDEWDARNPRLVRQGLSLLQRNIDLMKWACCILAPDANLGDCVERMLLDTDLPGMEAYIRFSTSIEGADSWPLGFAHDWQWKCRIRLSVNSLSEDWARLLDNVGERECLVLMTASDLLHEAVHCCSSEIDGRDATTATDKGPCGLAYMVSGIFAWAMGQRFSCLTSTDGCDFLKDPELFAHDWAFGYDGSPSINQWTRP